MKPKFLACLMMFFFILVSSNVMAFSASDIKFENKKLTYKNIELKRIWIQWGSSGSGFNASDIIEIKSNPRERTFTIVTEDFLIELNEQYVTCIIVDKDKSDITLKF